MQPLIVFPEFTVLSVLLCEEVWSCPTCPPAGAAPLFWSVGEPGPPPLPGVPLPEEAPPPPPAPGAAAPAGGFAKSTTSSNEVDTINLTFRAVSLTQVTGQADANKEIFYSVLNELKSSPFFVAEETHDTSPISPDDSIGTFTFGVAAKLKRPLKLF